MLSVFSWLKAAFALTAYLLVFTLLIPFLPLRLFWRAKKAPAYAKRIVERFGISRINPEPGGIWVHAVSVGETLAIAPSIKHLLEAYPKQSMTVTTMTPTGSERVQAIFADSVSHSYAPYDWPLFVLLFLLKVKPRLLVVVETELWPVTIGLCKLMGVKVLIANARLSEKSAKGYAKLAWLVRPMLKGITIAAQHNDDAQRFLALGAEEPQVHITGSVKFDLAITDEQRAKVQLIKEQLALTDQACTEASRRFIWIAASTHEGEDELLLDAHAQLMAKYPDSLLVLVPRHPERFDAVANKVDSRDMQLLRRSQNQPVSQNTQVLLVDTMGELSAFYGLANMAFIGGSLVPVGGHNYLEASVWGVPVLSGPHRHNFLAIAAQLESAGALTVVESAEALAQQLGAALENPEGCRERGARAVSLVARNQGATKKLLDCIAAINQ